MPRSTLSYAPAANLKAEPMPRHIAPMLATLTESLPRKERDFAAEYKWDGVRAMCFWDGKSVRLESRNLLDITHRYPELMDIGRALKRSSAILDGEIVALDEDARPNFGLLQRRMHVSVVSRA